VLNEIDRYHLVQDVIDRLPQLGARAAYVKQTIRDALIDHKEYIYEYGEDPPEISGWTWGHKQPSGHRESTESDNIDAGVEAPSRN
jgi:xylulose-5-phosphate/fructose-6-phosphate phosphoketolase